MSAAFPFKAIAAVSENGVIGADGKIPWHIPEEFRWFKETTVHHALVMGRKTYESIGKPLPDRMTFVLSRTWLNLPGVVVVASLDEVVEYIEINEFKRDIFIAGGAEVYRQALPRCSEILLTVVKKQVEGDTRFPEIGPEFRCEEKPLLEHAEFTVWRWVRVEA